MKQGLKHSRESSRVENLVKDGVERTKLLVVFYSLTSYYCLSVLSYS